jgi:hypothetical protein
MTSASKYNTFTSLLLAVVLAAVMGAFLVYMMPPKF